MKKIGDTVYALIDGRINRLVVERIDASCQINPSYYACNSVNGIWLRDSDAYDSVDELADSLKQVVVG